ncbi:UDP-4-amino-4,6-dideoxy-N-acetyl-beta-L-altrosamine transaminase [Magnetospirillum sp. ME-1]|uniref:UDP-4-amino-4, 6-dideoxy-N-acetyl-beta-L-altrosamine transaminase n=1 Tax=Magnetospirillum sp. ME-1 TaxID=1639348 RepID=UPI000A17A7A5|nr:UDP-4-amino-4,6-dideoxy-N-acetyl-beta-L-altrosamine transaminase [Magnetospirillum sp. ME-1]ARJ64606.1 UDP-4-amino-4,6-dideoxy-N-acetyl-beta-L-altrosamine transaminase [Magnetospirillum sp. ME-1]
MTEGGFLPYCRHVVDDDDIAAVAAVMKGDILTTGPAVAAFEDALAKVVGARHAVVCANGTAALHLAVMALGIGPGDAVLVPAQTFAATGNCARYVGAEVVLTDVDPDSGLMRAQDLEAAIAAHPGKRFRSVHPVHLNGQSADMPGLAAVARRHGLAIIEDCCHALGTIAADGTVIGDCRHGEMNVFSFHPAKTIAMGEGGAITTNDDALASRLRLLRSHGITRDSSIFVDAEGGFDAQGAPNPWYYEMQDLGFNYRACDIQCALGSSQLAKLPRFAEARRRLVRHYREKLLPLAPKVKPITLSGGDAVWHLSVALIDFAACNTTRAEVMNALKARGIGTQVNYIPMHKLPYYRSLLGEVSLPGAEEYYRRCLSLPLSAAMTEADVDRVVDTLREVLGL